jgi:hypothetical protein
MLGVRNSRAILLALISFALMFSTVQGISVANAAISRALPDGSTLYSISCDYGAPNGQLGGFVTSSGVPTGVQTRIGGGTTHVNSTFCAYGAAYNPVTGKAYWITQIGTGIETNKTQLFEINVATGESTYVAEIRADEDGRSYAYDTTSRIPFPRGITFDAAGNLYAMWSRDTFHVYIGKVALSNPSNDNTGKIDHDSVKRTGIDANKDVNNFAYNPTNQKFYAARSTFNPPSLYEIDVTAGTTIDLSTSGNRNARFWGMQFDSNGVMWGGDGKLNSATVAGWTTAGDLQQTAAFSTFNPLTRHGINAVFIVPISSTSPSAPTLNTVTGGDRSISVAFTAGANGGATITDYEYSLNGGTYRSAATTTSPFTITSEISGRTSYSVTLKARNSVGLSSASGSLSATTTDSSADASEAAAAAAEAARVAAAEAARVAAVNAAIAAAAAKRAAEQKEMSELLAVLPSIAGLALSIGDITNSLLAKQKCVNGKKTKSVSYGSKCPKGFVKRK